MDCEAVRRSSLLDHGKVVTAFPHCVFWGASYVGCSSARARCHAVHCIWICHCTCVSRLPHCRGCDHLSRAARNSGHVAEGTEGRLHQCHPRDLVSQLGLFPGVDDQLYTHHTCIGSPSVLAFDYLFELFWYLWAPAIVTHSTGGGGLRPELSVAVLVAHPPSVDCQLQLAGVHTSHPGNCPCVMSAPGRKVSHMGHAEPQGL